MFSPILLSIINCLSAEPDTILLSQNLDEVVISSSAIGKKRSAKGSVASIDEHLRELSHVELIRRGSYAWEPVVNNMQTERLSVTIDGMKIFYACTDKMDPVTSYVESGNLQSVNLNSGLAGNPQSTGNIGGSLDLRLRRVGFVGQPWRTNISVGHEFNGHLQVYGADASVSTNRAYTNFGAFFRHADNYKIGGGDELNFSQFQKVNAFCNFGFRPAENQTVEGAVIYDCATNVGYPALAMDVAKAEAIIASLSYKHTYVDRFVNSLETKVYANRLIHNMDDTHRPDVLIHMDMPGSSKTIGMYSLLSATTEHHSLRFNYDIYYNRLFADMTMYPDGAAPMYMVTWPDVGSLCSGIAFDDDIQLLHNLSVGVSGKVAAQHQQLNNDEGYNAQKVFFPHMQKGYNQLTGRVAAHLAWLPRYWQISIGGGWGSRAPSVTEAYGYYLNNTFDRFDYIGNPHLHNESATEANASVAFHRGALTLSADVNAFFFSNYIIGRGESRLSAMTIGAEGVKVYRNLANATIVNASFSTKYDFGKHLTWSAKLSYGRGKDDENEPLPLIAPVEYSTTLAYVLGGFKAQLTALGAAKQVNYAPKYAETQTPAYHIVNVNTEYTKNIGKHTFTLIVGIENLLDRNYSTYSDWNNIPQKGRNLYANVNWTW